MAETPWARGPEAAGRPGADAGRRLLVILPCFNEAGSIGRVLADIASLELRCDTLVIDDGSSDDTAQVAAATSQCVRLPLNLGIGAAVQTGIKYAFAHGYDLCVQVDGDGQHPPAQIARLLAAYRASPTALIIGSRFLGASSFRSTRLRRLGIALIAAVIRLLFGVRVTDPTSGLRLMDRAAMRMFASHYPLDFPEPISVAVAVRHGLSLQEVPVEMRAREHGKSSIAGLKTLTYMVRVIAYLLLTKLGS